MMTKKELFLQRIHGVSKIIFLGPLAHHCSLINHENALVLAIDGGRIHHQRLPIDFSVGDGDSYQDDISHPFELDEKLPIDKDFSDFCFALSLIPAKFEGEILCYGLWGERADHFLAILGEVNEKLLTSNLSKISFIHQDLIQLEAYHQKVKNLTVKGSWSILSLNEQKISLSGSVKFSSLDKLFKPLSSLGLSNEMNGDICIHAAYPYFLIRAE